MYKDTKNKNPHREAIAKMYDNVEMPGGWKFNHMNTLRTIDLFTNSKYSTGDFDDQGYFKFFRNISNTPCDVASKMIDLDVQNFRFIPRPSMMQDVTTNEMCVYYMSKDFKVYADEHRFGKLINDLGDDLPKYGSIFVKDVNGVARRVAPHNMKFDPSAKDLRSSYFVAEPYLMRKNELKMNAHRWNNPKNLNTLFDRAESDLYLIYEFYWNNGGKWKFEVIADVFCWKDKSGGIIRSLESNINYQGEQMPTIILHEEDVKKLRYYDHKWKHVDGRLLGYGYVEYLLHDQIATNETENMERKGLHISSLSLLQTRDTSVGGKNVLTHPQNGDIITVEHEITKIPLEERNLAAYNATNSRWAQSVTSKTFSPDVATGGNLPSRTPLGVANLQAGMVTSFYEKKQESFGMFLKDDVLKEIIIPSFKEKTSKEHLLTIGPDEKDMEEYERFIARVFVDKAVADYAEKNGYFPSLAQRKKVEEQVMMGLKGQKYKTAKIRDYYYDNASYKMEIDVTGESVDTGIRSAVIQTGMQIMGSNPAIMQNATTRSMFFRFLALGNVTPQELGIDVNNIDMTPVQPGGSVSAGAPLMSTSTQTI
jgi:hypothetical protein